MIIETNRLILREYVMEDFDALYEIMSDEETMQHYPAPFDEERTMSWITWNLDNYKKYGFGLWAVVLKETNEFIGDCGITIQNIDGEMLPEIGYHINKKYWRRGFGKEAAKAVRDWVFLNTDYNEIYSYMKYTNVGSYSTAIANGMKKVKEYPDPKNTISYAYSITREEWNRLCVESRMKEYISHIKTQIEDKRHIVITGSIGAGKSTLLKTLVAEIGDGSSLLGLVTWCEPGKAVYMRLVGDNDCVTIGTYNPAGTSRETMMIPHKDAFDVDGVAILEHLINEQAEWITIDEIGFLEAECERFLRKLDELFNQKRVIVVVRKQQLEHIKAIVNRKDAVVVDLDRDINA